MLRTSKDEVAPKVNPVQRPDYTDADAWALRAVSVGTATEEQQKRAIEFIVHTVCGTYDLAYRPRSARDTDFALGKQRVGQDLIWLLKNAPTKTQSDKVSARKLGEEK